MFPGFSERLPLNFTAPELVSFIAGAFCLLALSVIVLHAFIPTPQPVLSVLLHAIGVSLTYTVALIVVVAAVFGFSVAGYDLEPRIWQVWVLSFLTYVAGFYLSPISDLLTGSVKFELHEDLAETSQIFHFLRLVPVWALITYLFISFLQRRGLLKELEELSLVNDQLQSKEKTETETHKVEFTSGKKQIAISANEISHISVEDHYCYVHYSRDGTFGKFDVLGPLSSVEPILPSTFIKVHRSHVVNLDKISHVEKQDRNYALLLDNNQFRVPISRGRLQEVLPRLQRFLTA